MWMVAGEARGWSKNHQDNNVYTPHCSSASSSFALTRVSKTKI